MIHVPSDMTEAEYFSRFLLEAADYFENRPTGNEDSAYWANTLNAEKCRRAARLLSVLR